MALSKTPFGTFIKSDNKSVCFTAKDEKLLHKYKDNDNHTFVRANIAFRFGKEEFRMAFAKIAKRSKDLGHTSAEDIQRRHSLTQDMLGEIRGEYGKECVEYLTQFL